MELGQKTSHHSLQTEGTKYRLELRSSTKLIILNSQTEFWIEK